MASSSSSSSACLLLRRAAAAAAPYRASRLLCRPTTQPPASSPSLAAHSLYKSGSLQYRWELPRCLSAAAPQDSSLLASLRDEIQHEKEVENEYSREKKQPPEPFTIVDKPGTEEVYLHRSYGEEEDITVACLFQSGSSTAEDTSAEGDDQPDEEAAAADGEQPSMVQMTVKISKGGDDPYIEIGCSSYGDEPVIDRVSFKENVDVADLPYEGPDFSSLDDKVKDGFHNYLRVRGINAQLGEYLLQYMYFKEQREYSRWLKKLESFLQK